MSARLTLKLPSGEIGCDILETRAAEGLIGQLPVSARGNVWGEEIYFRLPGALNAGSKTRETEVGDIAYWEEGQSLCIFFGPTPVSRSGRPEPYVPVFRIGSLEPTGRALAILRSFEQGQVIALYRSSQAGTG